MPLLLGRGLERWLSRCRWRLVESRNRRGGRAWRKGNASMSKAAVAKTLMVNQLVDMQWKFGVTASSDDAAQLGNTFLQLKLVTDKGSRLETSYMELSLPQFYEFMHEMEKCKASLDAFSV